LLVAVHEALSRVDKKHSKLEDELHEIGDGIEAFREALLDHFAREQEGLLPFVVSHLPRFRDRSETLIVEHDRIAESLTKVVTSFHGITPDNLPAWREDLSRFEDLYATHTKSENAFLDEVTQSLTDDPSATDRLRELINA
jgi:iron-sulfur cluster repair protein YtfE (RIC family)